VPEDLEQAARYSKMTEDQGLMKCTHRYGEHRRKGWGVAKDVLEAARCHKVAAGLFNVVAHQTDAVSRNAYGVCLANGRGGKKGVRQSA